MIYFIALFCSPLALLLALRPISALFNLILWVLAVALTLSLVFAHAGFVLYVIALAHAVLVIHNAREDRRARWIADAMARRE